MIVAAAHRSTRAAHSGSPGWTTQRTLRGMAARSWATSILTAIGVAAGAAAALLGIGYGLGIIAWQPVAGGATTTWVNSLAWVTWIAATSTVFGALFADRLSTLDMTHADDESPGAQLVGIAWRVVMALAAAVGALLTVPLVALPARTPRADNAVPYFAAGGYAVAGVIVGLVIAIGALTARAFAANVIASTAWIGTLAVVAVADTVHRGGDLAGSAQLATWQFTDATWVRGMVNLPGALLMLAVALVIGGLAAWPAGRRGDNRVGVAISGAAGPLLVAAAYFLAAPGLGQHDQHLSSFVMAPYAVLAGLGGSVLVAAIGPKGLRTEQRTQRRASTDRRDAQAAADLVNWNEALAKTDAARARDEEFTGRSRDEQLTYAGTPTATDSARDLDEDSYASPRAYEASTYEANPEAREYAADLVDPEPTGTTSASATSSASGRAAVKEREPLWPTQPDPQTTQAPQPKGGRPRRGKPGGSTD
jgi:hypothetical protein